MKCSHPSETARWEQDRVQYDDVRQQTDVAPPPPEICDNPHNNKFNNVGHKQQTSIINHHHIGYKQQISTKIHRSTIDQLIMGDTEVLLVRQEVIYCGACGMPPEFCEYGPDFETHCAPWLSKHHKDLFDKLQELRGGVAPVASASNNNKPDKPAKPENPRTNEERLVAFYEQYEKNKLDSIPGLLEKYAGKEDKLFVALTKKYGPEPPDPYYTESEDEDEDEEELGEEMADLAVGDKKKRRGAGAKKKKGDTTQCRVVVQKRAQNKRRFLTVVMGMETVQDIKLKDVSKAFSKRFAGSSSVKDGAKAKEKEIIIQGDHVFDVAEMIVDKFGVPDTAVFVDCDGDVVSLR